jgi:hypothetical protein
MQVLESFIDQVHANENVERRSIDASKEAIGDARNVICLNCSTAVTWCSTKRSTFTHRLHTMGLELSTSTMCIWRFMDYLHLQYNNFQGYGQLQRG